MSGELENSCLFEVGETYAFGVGAFLEENPHLLVNDI